MIYKLCKKVILSGNYDKDEMLKKLDVFLLRDRITEEQYEELTSLMEKENE